METLAVTKTLGPSDGGGVAAESTGFPAVSGGEKEQIVERRAEIKLCSHLSSAKTDRMHLSSKFA